MRLGNKPPNTLKNICRHQRTKKIVCVQKALHMNKNAPISAKKTSVNSPRTYTLASNNINTIYGGVTLLP